MRRALVATAHRLRFILAPGGLHMETIFVATNFENSGQDKVLGVFQWGWNSHGKDAYGQNIQLGNTISPKALEIIKNDYPNYTFYGN